ncbi:MAG: metallophosphoesterase family protein [candidate division WOR-3 bacterium]|nr:MAG: metallophosphoesterase family protein [candidate division WOR-3 bacterium]
MKKYAIISDIHGNCGALEAVLADIRTRAVRDIINLGDALYGPLDPSGTAELIVDLNIRSVRGNEDRMICSARENELSPTLQYVRSRLKREQVEWLSCLPCTATIDNVLFACHGSPRSDTEYFFWHINPDGKVLRNGCEMEKMVKKISCRVVLCGHDHVPRSLFLNNGTLVVDPGSVGLQAFQDETPHRHAMQNHSPHARYTILTEGNGTWHAEHQEVVYDWEAASSLAGKNGRADWAFWLRTGQVKAD